MTRAQIHAWLASNSTNVPRQPPYGHQKLTEQAAQRTAIIAPLRAYVQAAHNEVKQRFLRVAALSLNPVAAANNMGTNPIPGYPDQLPDVTLQGYMGEIFAGIVAKYFDPFNEIWEVPGYLFRHHNLAFEYLEGLSQGEPRHDIPGRTGDDCLAFQRNATGDITKVLVCEAKCTPDHNSAHIRDAHEKLSKAHSKPISLMEMVEAMEDSQLPNKQQWIDALLRLRLSPTCDRSDLVSYICGRSPVNKATWISTSGPHRSYTGNRRLEAVEIHIQDVIDLINQVYR